jgi:hypothetical protein
VSAEADRRRARRRETKADDDDLPVLPERTFDEDVRGWGDADDRSDRDGWYERERPPHHE